MSKHVVVVGGGVIGLSAAWECARLGFQVTVLEQAPEQRGASLGNAGMVVPSHFVPLAAPGMVALGLKWMWNPESPFYIQPRMDVDLIAWAWRFWRSSTRAHVLRSAPLLRDMHLASRQAYARFAEGEDIGLVDKGLLMLCKSQQTLDEEAELAHHAKALDVPAEVLNASQTAAQDPGVTMDVAGAVYFPQDCHLNPAKYVAALEKRLLGAGGRIFSDCVARGWMRDGRRLRAVVTSQGEIEGDEFVLAGGAWSPELARGLGLNLPMQPGRGYSVTHPAPVELPQLCSILTEARVAVTPMGGSLRFGGTMEIVPMQQPLRLRRVSGILKAVPRYFPRFEPGHFSDLKPWSGLRPCSPDGLPYLGRTAAAPNVVVATGHAMMGLSLAPVTGELVGALVTGAPPSMDLALLSPDRFA